MRLKFGLMSALAVACFSGTAIAQTDEPSVVVTVVKMEPSSYNKRQCDLEFNITNNGYGTIHRIRAHLIGYDDRGREVDEVMSATADNKSGFSYKPIAVGQTARNVGDASFKEDCEYLKEIQFDGVKDQDCAMRMLPEDASCQSFITLMSDLPNLKIRPH